MENVGYCIKYLRVVMGVLREMSVITRRWAGREKEISVLTVGRQITASAKCNHLRFVEYKIQSL